MNSTRSKEPRAYQKQALLFATCLEIAVYKKFLISHNYSLILYQAEIANLEIELNAALRAWSSGSNEGDIPPDSRVKLLQKCLQGPDAPWTLISKMRGLLQEYSAALLSFREIQKLPQTNPRSLTALIDWYHDPKGGNAFRHGVEDKIWDNTEDLTCLSRSDDAVDGILLQFRDMVVSALFWLFRDKKKQHVLPLWTPTPRSKPVDAPLTWIPESKVTSVLNVVSTILASTLPALSIFTLMFVHSLLVRVGIILMFTLMFSITMALLGKARRAEIWAVSAAFSAVLVVFVGGNNSIVGSGGGTPI